MYADDTAEVADVALPVKLAVMLPAEKLPNESRATSVETELAVAEEIVIVGLPPTPSALVIDKPVPNTAIERVV